jgi:hypothetical protein
MEYLKDIISYLNASGCPKSQNNYKAIQKIGPDLPITF